MKRQCVKSDKDSGIINGANDWATETLGNARYPLEPLPRVFAVGLGPMKIVNVLKNLEFLGGLTIPAPLANI